LFCGAEFVGAECSFKVATGAASPFFLTRLPS
jgi:hypothetical protein